MELWLVTTLQDTRKHYSFTLLSYLLLTMSVQRCVTGSTRLLTISSRQSSLPLISTSPNSSY